MVCMNTMALLSSAPGALLRAFGWFQFCRWGRQGGSRQVVALRNNTHVPKVPVSFGFHPSSCPQKWDGRAGQGMKRVCGCSDKSLQLQDDLERDQAKSLPARGSTL